MMLLFPNVEREKNQQILSLWYCCILIYICIWMIAVTWLQTCATGCKLSACHSGEVAPVQLYLYLYFPILYFPFNLHLFLFVFSFEFAFVTTGKLVLHSCFLPPPPLIFQFIFYSGLFVKHFCCILSHSYRLHFWWKSVFASACA